jgi:hypothetical protein
MLVPDKPIEPFLPCIMLQERLEHTKTERLTDSSTVKGWPYLQILEQVENFAKDKHTSLFDFCVCHKKVL